jgi:hypothetical protein
MQPERIAETSALSRSVRGLGVCDALRLELLPEQLPQLVEQVQALRRSLSPEAADYELRIARLLCDALPSPDTSQPLVFIGPTHIVRNVVWSSLHAAAAALHDELSNGSSAHGRLADAAACAAAWARTHLECQAVEEFSFDPCADPPRP